jgi:hypothetical protein
MPKAIQYTDPRLIKKQQTAKRYYEKHKERHKAAAAARYQKIKEIDPVAADVATMTWRKENRERYNEYQRQYQTKLRKIPGSVQWRRIALRAHLAKERRKKQFEEKEALRAAIVKERFNRERRLREEGIQSITVLEIRNHTRKIKENKTCLDCKNPWPPCALEFDHRDPMDKKFNVGSARPCHILTIAELDQEIAKCDLVCKCCHAIRTQSRGFRKRPKGFC